MINIDFSNNKFKFKTEQGVDFIFDVIRKKWLVITPEEWVRQNVVQVLIRQLNYPASLFAIEKEITVNHQKKRFDIVIFKNEKPWMLVECKQAEVIIDDKTIQQILAYNSVIKAEYFVITNGKKTYCWQSELQEVVLTNDIPKWK